MAREMRKPVSLFMCVFVTVLLSINSVIPVISSSVEDQKNYYSTPVPHAAGSPPPPSVSHGSPPHRSTSSHPPPHGSASHRGRSHDPPPSPPSGGNCGTPPPSHPTPSHPTPSHPTPSHPTPTPSPPTYQYYPPTPVITSPPTPPTPSIDPGTPTVNPTPTPPFFPVPFPCNYWMTHPALIWALLGWWGTTGNAFAGLGGASIQGFDSSMSLQEALSNTRTDGYGSLFREGTASWLNSLANRRFPFTTNQVRDNFLAALHSESDASSQAQLFKLANEGHLQPRN
ncbi:hypothetical protein CFOL_v3_08680 [Cephalotus follicularis]|uniref:Uncharacterized protein n=1 Tax=Cephalotus follicularis TaxID=3775 RepID=A0A1Q3BB97_CEPFO|nr:hypothetical protein CFOL_v3_08680 [Cephalotus follicularis]